MNTTGIVNTSYVIYGKKNCAGCEQAKALLDSKGLGYQYIDVVTSPKAQQLFRENGWRSVPQIVYNGECVTLEQLKEGLT